MIIFNCGFSTKMFYHFYKISELNALFYFIDQIKVLKVLKGARVNRAMPSLHGGSL